jgi:hypothetical protein
VADRSLRREGAVMFRIAGGRDAQSDRRSRACRRGPSLCGSGPSRLEDGAHRGKESGALSRREVITHHKGPIVLQVLRFTGEAV